MESCKDGDGILDGRATVWDLSGKAGFPVIWAPST